MKEKLGKKYVIYSKGNGYISSDHEHYTDNIDDAFVYYDKADAKSDVYPAEGDKILEITTKNTLVKRGRKEK